MPKISDCRAPESLLNEVYFLYVSNKLIGICPSQSDMPKVFQSYKSTITWEWLSKVDHLNVLWYWDVQLNMIRPIWVCSWPIKLQDSWKFNSSRTSRDMKLIFHIHRYPKKATNWLKYIHWVCSDILRYFKKYIQGTFKMMRVNYISLEVMRVWTRAFSFGRHL